MIGSLITVVTRGVLVFTLGLDPIAEESTSIGVFAVVVELFMAKVLVAITMLGVVVATGTTFGLRARFL